jgi:hypothetical protein
MGYVVDLLILTVVIYAYGNLYPKLRALKERVRVLEQKTENIEIE